MSLKNKVIGFFSNKFLQMGVMIACAIILTITVGLAIGALNTVPNEFLPLIQSLVVFMVLGMISLLFLVLMFVVLSGKINTVITKTERAVTAAIDKVEASAEKVAEATKV
ncbi:MAG TPA: hypothetical protein PK573_07760 [Spirochaetota bacterium]|nr:hypothetical protein [Spirochaetota bacterium]HSA14987.1 hypothetical protein [Spirochaetota bacterium]